MTLDNRTNIVNNMWGDDCNQAPPSQSGRKIKLDFDPNGTNKTLKLKPDTKTKLLLSKVLKKIMPMSTSNKASCKLKRQSLNASLNRTMPKAIAQMTPKSRELKFSRSFKNNPNLSVTLDGRRTSHRRENSFAATTPVDKM